jgi:lactoylglutathione lyase
MHIDHIAIWTLDLDRLKDFYSSCFSCSVSALYVNSKNQFSSYFLSFNSGARIEIMKRVDITQANEGEKIGLTHFAIRLENSNQVDELTETLRKQGVSILGNPRVTGDGYYESVICDPDGNRIELVASPADIQEP